MSLNETIHLIIIYLQGIFAFDPNSPLLFTQLQFWVFFAVVFLGFALIVSAPHRRVALMRNAYLFFVSLLFYYKTSGFFVGLLILVTCTDYLLARRIFAVRTKSRWRARALLSLSVFIDLGLLCYFKYSYFFADMLNQLFGLQITVSNIAASAGNILTHSQFWSVDRIVLPVGISFYTFQVISYTADVYKGLVRPVRNILDFGFYVSFFPQLVAGPIIKASDFIPQLYRRYSLSRMQFGMAVFWILNGLLKKIVLSDYLAVNFIDRVFASPQFFSGFENLMALFVYSLQVYADFSGYTDIAIGLSQLMGFYLPMNFNSPYKAQNCSNFWKRWHISLSRWLQTYLYIPLGGNRNTTGATYFWISVITLAALILSGSVWVASLVVFVLLMVVWTAYRHPDRRRHIYANLNSMITMVLGGLWHGASCNFMVWGGLNGVGMIVYKFWRDMSALRRAVLTTFAAAVLGCLVYFSPAALWNVLFCFVAFICVSAWIRYVNAVLPFHFTALEGVLGRAWSIGVTFTFITFTRLFFRSGSNLDPAVANETAWRIATQMVEAIGTRWNVNVWAVCEAYRSVFLLFVFGMVVHWLPTDWKRRYRICFARMPLPLMVFAVLAVVFIAYQFVTAEMQPFIYFQF
ncbi:MAG: MBOAT family protein [Bacteroidaceae bacterium]|nr:MBOAT family protein [Bacteroidaceae bacterium]